MDEILTIAEIEARFSSEWVLVEDPETDDSLELKGGRVRYHSKDRDEVYRKAVELKPSRFAVHYTGEIPTDAAVVLRALRPFDHRSAVRQRGEEGFAVGLGSDAGI